MDIRILTLGTIVTFLADRRNRDEASRTRLDTPTIEDTAVKWMPVDVHIYLAFNEKFA
jgi:hypothetical protein